MAQFTPTQLALSDRRIQEYKNYISLGYFCEVARDLEALGLRNTSSPFDWEISEFRGVIKAIDNQFYNFMAEDSLYQSEKHRNHYYDSNYGIWFFHDFDQYKSLEQQYQNVYQKYNRRINRFLKNIEEPTLFFRYIMNEPNMHDEIGWIEENYDYILHTIKKYNPKNDIVYIGDNKTNSANIKIYHVEPDENSFTSRHPILNNKELYPIVCDFHVPYQQQNIIRFNKKQLKKKSILNRSKNAIIRNLKGKILKIYIHDKTINGYK